MNAAPEAQALPRDDATLAVRGTLGFDTAPALLEQSADWVRRAGADPLTVDLGGVERVDSAGLALLVEWVNLAQGRRVRFANVPAQARELARVYGLGDALGLDRNA